MINKQKIHIHNCFDQSRRGFEKTGSGWQISCFIHLIILFLLSFFAMETKGQSAIVMPRPEDVLEIKITRDMPHYFDDKTEVGKPPGRPPVFNAEYLKSEKSLWKFLPCFTPRSGTYVETAMKAAQRGTIKLKNGQIFTWAAMNKDSILLSNDKGVERLFQISPDCSAMRQLAGKHGGLLKIMQDYWHLDRGAQVELVLEKESSKSNLYRAVIYVSDLNGTNATGSVLWAELVLISNGKELRVPFVNSTAERNGKSRAFKTRETFVAAPDSVIEIFIRFAGKSGTGIAVFDSFRKSSE